MSQRIRDRRVQRLGSELKSYGLYPGAKRTLKKQFKHVERQYAKSLIEFNLDDFSAAEHEDHDAADAHYTEAISVQSRDRKPAKPAMKFADFVRQQR